MLKIGLTGGIGSGKTVIARLFEVLGIPVYNADTRTRELMNSDPRLKSEIISHFGDEAYSGHQLNRSFLATLVFNNPEKLELLNSITHPVTIQDAEDWMNRQDAPYCIKEAALLFESGAAGNLDFVVGVYAPRNLRMKRVMTRDGFSVDEVLKRMNRQIDEEMKMKLCDFIITNNDQQLVIPQVIELDKKFRNVNA